jgi:HEAT repeat protein
MDAAYASTETVKTLSPSAQVLLGKIYSSNETERVNAALRLANYNHAQVVDTLIWAAENDKSDMVKRVALRSLGQIGDGKAVRVILDSISSDSLGVKVEAMGAAVHFSTPPVREALIVQADAPNPLVRQKAVTYLGNIKRNNQRVINVITGKLKDISEGVRVSALVALKNKKSAKTILYVLNVLKEDRSGLVREYASEVLGNMDSRNVVKGLKEALEDTDPVVRITSARSLARLGNKAGLNHAIEGIRSSDSKVRIISCEIIGMIGNEKSLILLHQAANDFDIRVQRAAKEAINKLKE